MATSEREGQSPRCVVAGAGPRLGPAIAARFAAEGFAVYALSRGPDVLDFGLSALRSAPCDVLVYNAFVEDGGRASVADALACAKAVICGMRAKRGGAILFSSYADAAEPALRDAVEQLSKHVEPFGIRVGMVAIDGTLPVAAMELAAIADRYWDLFFAPDSRYERVLRVRTRV